MSLDEQRAMAHAVVNRIAAARRLPAPWPDAATALPGWLDDIDLTDWGVEELGTLREQLLPMDERKTTGAWYTPLTVAESMVDFAIVPQLDRLSAHPDPGNVLQVLAIDPSCGAGVFLVAAARRIATCYATRIAAYAGGTPTLALARFVMPEVLSECIFGIDIDPVAVDLARSALWLEAGGQVPITFMDRNVIVGDPLEGPHVSPPKFEERRAAV